MGLIFYVKNKTSAFKKCFSDYQQLNLKHCPVFILWLVWEPLGTSMPNSMGMHTPVSEAQIF